MFKKVLAPFLAAICCVSACKKDKKQQPPRNLEIETRSATVHAKGGVTLEGKIVNSDMARVYGFFYSTDSTFNLLSGNYDFGYVSEPYQDGIYKLDINKGLYKDSIYYYRAYALRDDNSTDLFGELRSFVSTGSSPISVDSISLKKAYERDLIKIYGKNFYQDYLEVYISGRAAYPARALSDSVIECQVPAGLGAGEHFVKVKATGTEDSIGGFSLYTPRVVSFTETATFGDSIVIKGEHFDDNSLYNRVTIGNTSLTIYSSARDRIVAYIPQNLEKSRGKLVVHTQSQQAAGDKDFQLLKPVIETVTNPIMAGQGLTIKGKYFHPERFRNEVFLDGIYALEQSYGSAQEMNVMVPDGLYADRKVKLTFKLLDMTIEYPVELDLANKFLLKSNQVPFIYNAHPGAFTAGNKGYAMTVNYSTGAGTVWSLDPASYSWSGKPLPAGIQLSSDPTVTGAGNKGYLYTGAADNSFYEYAPETNVWTRKADFPGLHRTEAVSFSIGSKVYVGGGYYYNDFYAYDPALNTWSKVPDFNFQINIASPVATVTVMNNKAYVFAGVNNFCYDPATNAWARLSDLSQPVGGERMSFALNNKIYITDVDGYLWAWDAFSNAFVQREGFPIRTGTLYSFVLNGKVYAGGGGSLVNADPPFVSDARLYEWDYIKFP